MSRSKRNFQLILKSYTYQSLQQTAQSINNHLLSLQQAVAPLQEKVNVIHELKQKNTALHANIEALRIKELSNYNPLSLLISLAQCMPPQSWLTSVRIGNKKMQNQHLITSSKPTAEKKMSLPIILSGIANHPREINMLTKKITALLPKTQLSVATTKKTKQKNTHEPSYAFTINGMLHLPLPTDNKNA